MAAISAKITHHPFNWTAHNFFPVFFLQGVGFVCISQHFLIQNEWYTSWPILSNSLKKNMKYVESPVEQFSIGLHRSKFVKTNRFLARSEACFLGLPTSVLYRRHFWDRSLRHYGLRIIFYLPFLYESSAEYPFNWRGTYVCANVQGLQEANIYLSYTSIQSKLWRHIGHPEVFESSQYYHEKISLCTFKSTKLSENISSWALSHKSARKQRKAHERHFLVSTSVCPHQRRFPRERSSSKLHSLL